MFLYPGVKVAFGLSDIYKFTVVTGYLNTQCTLLHRGK